MFLNWVKNIIIAFSITIASCANIKNWQIVKKDSRDKNTLLISRYPPKKTIPLIDGFHGYELSYSQKDFYRLRSWSWKAADNLRIELDDGYILIGYTPCGATAAVILPKGKLILFEKKFIGWRKIPAVSIYMRFHPAEIGNIFSEALIEIAIDRERFSNASDVVQNKGINTCSSRTGDDNDWKVIIPEPAKYIIDADIFQEGGSLWIVENNKVDKIPNFYRSSSLPYFCDNKISPAQAKENFNLIWSRFDRIYPSFASKKIDWPALKEQYESRASQAANVGEFLGIIREMLSKLKDSHIWIDTPEGTRSTYDSYDPNVNYHNYNFQALRKYMDSIEQIGETILLARTSDKLTYIAFTSWGPGVQKDIEELKKYLPDILNSRGGIIDVRVNTGGIEPLALIVAACFTDKPVVYAQSIFRNGPRHTDLTEPKDRILEPDKGGIYYSRPTIVLIGPQCASSNESFVSAMNEIPQVTLMGDRTAGSSGNPTFVELNLPAKISISIPQWIDLLPDGTPLEKEGIKPDVVIEASKEDFSGDNDPVLEQAINLMGSAE